MSDDKNVFENGQVLQWRLILRVSVILIFAAVCTFALHKWRKFVSLINKIPQTTLRFYHFLGHAQIGMYYRFFLKTALPFHVYDFQAMSGYCQILRKEGLTILWAATHPVVLVFNANAVEAILNHSTQLKKAWMYKFTRPWLGDGLLTSDGGKWKTRRKLLTPAFHFNILNDFLPMFNSKANIFMDVLSNHTEDEFVDIIPLVTRCSLDIICDSLLGVDLHVQKSPSNPYVQSVNFLTGAISERFINVLIWPDVIFKYSKLGRKFHQNKKLVQDFTLKLIRDKKAKLMSQSTTSVPTTNEKSDGLIRKKRALLDLLLDEHMNNNSLSERDIIEEVDTFTFEGHDTTSLAISWTLYMLGLHQGIQDNVEKEIDSIFCGSDRDATTEDIKDMKYLEIVIKPNYWKNFQETLRLYPSVPMYGRLLTEDVQMNERIVPKGSTCIVFAYMLHRDPTIFPNPEKFDPDRFLPENTAGRHPFCYTPFSAGPRNCIGQRFAMMEIKVIVSSVLRKYTIRSLDPRDKVHLISEIVLRPLNGLRIEIRNRDRIPENPPVYYHYP